MEITTLDNIEFKGKTFVFDSSIAAFHCGGKWITDEEYVDLGWPHYDVYLSEYDNCAYNGDGTVNYRPIILCFQFLIEVYNTYYSRNTSRNRIHSKFKKSSI